MKRRIAIRWAWLPGILLLGLVFWLWPRDQTTAPAPPGMTRDEANRQAMLGERRKALDELAAQAQKLDMGY